MGGKRKEVEKNLSPVANKKIKKSKPSDFSDDEDLSDIEDAEEIFNGIRIPKKLPPIMSAEENPGPRLIIKDIVANNFKSYYGQVTIGPFHKSLTSIVGANGSGKSNVIDSLLFVFGYRSSKIRSKKVSVLLHNSDKHKDVRQCSVAVNFVLINDDDTQESGFVTIPNSEITITRTAFKDNSSFYTLNNKRVKFKEIAVILKKNGIDMIHNRFLILQGEVEQIAMMKPKAENEHSTGMLEYLEDVIGTVRYKEPLKKLEEKVSDLSLEKSEKLSRLKYVTKEIEELLEPVKEIINFQQKENQLNWKKNKLYQKELFNLSEKMETEKEKLKKTKNEINSVDDELANFEKNKENENKIIEDLSVKLQTDISKFDKLGKEIKICCQKSDTIKQSLLDKAKEIKQYENSILQEKKKITKAEAVPKVKECELKRLESELPSLEEECAKLEEKYSKTHASGFEKSKKFREEKDKLAPEELKLQTIFGDKQNLFQTLKTEFEVLLDTEKTEKEKLRVLEEQMMKGVDEFQENERKKEKAEADINNFRNKIRDWEENIQSLKNDEQEIKAKLQNIRLILTEKRTAYAETTGRSQPIQYILKLKDQGRIKGILGRCGDYGQVEGKYDIPACTACGSTDQIVVEAADAAQACIDMLKKNNVGRLTFSVLPQIQQFKSSADAVNTYPENSKRVFDLIQILDQRFRLTFYTGLYETLLAESLEQARRIAFGTKTRYRVVTFKGELIDKSGIMSGGGRPIKGKIGPQENKTKYASGNTHQVSQNEVEKLDKAAKELESKLRETETTIFDLKANVEQHRKLIDDLNITIRHCLSRMNAWKTKKLQVENLIETQKLVIVQKKTDPMAVANKEAEIKKAEEELNVAKKNYHTIKSKCDDLNEKIKEITEGEPREAKCLLDEANDKLDKTRCAINQVNVCIQAAERQIKKSKTQLETLEDRIDKTKKNVETLNAEALEYDSKTVKYNESYDEMRKDIDEQRQYIKELKNKHDDGFQRLNELRESKITLKHNLKTTEDSISHLMDVRNSLKKKLSGLKLHKIRQIDGVIRDPVLESYKDFDTNNKENVEKGEESQEQIVEPQENGVESQERNDQDQMQVNHEHQNIPGIEDYTNESCTELPKYSCEQLADFNPHDIQNVLEKEEDEIINTRPNFNLLEEYDKRTKQYNEKFNEVTAVLKLYYAHNEMLNKVRQRRRDEFMVSYTKITVKLKEMYQMITLGGDAELELVDTLDPFSAGIDFSVRPPKKSWKIISNLSGGEKTLSSLALVFALHYYKPSPLYVMDEIDAALDFKNVSIIGHYIKERTKNSQFIIISLRSNMFEKANLLIGIYKTSDCTETCSIKTNDYFNIIKGPLATQYHNDENCLV